MYARSTFKAQVYGAPRGLPLFDSIDLRYYSGTHVLLVLNSQLAVMPPRPSTHLVLPQSKHVLLPKQTKNVLLIDFD